ncbi:MAG TPA: F0F1 ATP synthase subunit B [Candidatus Saccharimonadales bacterium]
MEYLTHIIATAETHSEAQPSLFSALGIDWQVLLLQTLAFLVLLWFLAKFVYPPLVKAIDSREKAIAKSVAAAQEAETQAAETQKEIAALLKAARKDADAVVETAQKEAATIVADAEDKAVKRAERIVADAQAQLEQDVAKARVALQGEMTQLVAQATEKIIRTKLDPTKDADLIKAALSEAK